MERANLLVAQGDVGAARNVLERAAELGNAAALFALAKTHDPSFSQHGEPLEHKAMLPRQRNSTLGL